MCVCVFKVDGDGGGYLGLEVRLPLCKVDVVVAEEHVAGVCDADHMEVQLVGAQEARSLKAGKYTGKGGGGGGQARSR